jgi:hypothetical protein
MLQLQNNGAAHRPVPTVGDSIDRMVDAAQKVVGDEVTLFRAEVSSATTAALQSGATVLLATVMLAVGWVIAMMAAFQVLAPRTGSLAALAGLSGLNLVFGTLLLLRARRRLRELGDG